jgi:hypothetical protein
VAEYGVEVVYEVGAFDCFAPVGVEVQHVERGVYPAVGASGSYHRRTVGENDGEGAFHLLLHAASASLALPSVKAAAAI